jgi:biotin carboxyl carrier protein
MMKFEAVINSQEKKIIKVDGSDIFADDIKYEIDHDFLPDGRFHLIANNKNFIVSILKADHHLKAYTLQMNGRVYQVRLKDPFDQQLESLGMRKNNINKVDVIKAPMPGLVVKVLVKLNQEIKKGDKILILKAMKMENVIKSPSDSIVKKIMVSESEAVERDQELIIL